ncbi:hypothetical protein GCM10009801_21650 [Streptomyces albiaxialis]|uniref:Secreted protein n=1 Tax=Streptomyces albiaxialis TaxID=329523 RepID=A0ABN2VRY9_9ACTN
MSRSRTPERGLAVLAGLLLLVCGVLFGASPASAAPSGAGSAKPAAHASVAHAASAASAPASYEEPGTGDTSPGPGCHKQKKGDVDGAVPAPASGAQNLVAALSACLVPESHAALGAAHARPPVRGPTPAQPPTPVELSVLRV